MVNTNYSNTPVMPSNGEPKDAGNNTWNLLSAAPLKNKADYFEKVFNRVGLNSYISEESLKPMADTLGMLTEAYQTYKKDNSDEQHQQSINQFGENLHNLVNYFEAPDRPIEKRSVMDSIMMSICNVLSSLAEALSFPKLAGKFSDLALKLEEKQKDNLLKFLSRTLLDPQNFVGALPENVVADSDQKVQNRSALPWQDGVYKVFKTFIQNADIELDDTNFTLVGDREENKRLWNEAYGNLNFSYEEVEKTLEAYGKLAKELIEKQNPVESEQPTQPIDMMEEMQAKVGIAMSSAMQQDDPNSAGEIHSDGN